MAAGEAMVGPGGSGAPSPLRDHAVGAAAVLLLGAALALDLAVVPGPRAGFLYVVPFLVVAVGLPRASPLPAAAVAVLVSAAGLLLSPPGVAAVSAVAAGSASWIVAAGVPAALALTGRAVSWLLIAGIAVAVERHRRGAGGPAPRDDPYRVRFREHDAAVLVIDPADGAIVDANPAAARLFGFPPGALRAMELADPDGMPGGAGLSRLLARRRGPVRCVLRDAAGAERRIEVVVVPVTAEGRSLLYATVHDVSEEYRAGAAIRDGGAQLRSLVDGLPGGVVLCGATDGTTDLRVLDLNDAGERLFGRTRDEVIGRSPEELLGEAWPSWAGAFSGTLETGRPGTVAVAGPAGDRFEVRLYRPAPGQVAGLAIDVTVRERAEEDLRLSCARLDRAVRLACCDLREPLWTIASFADLLRRRAGDRLDSDDREVIDYILASGQRLERRIDSLLRDTCLESGPADPGSAPATAPGDRADPSPPPSGADPPPGGR